MRSIHWQLSLFFYKQTWTKLTEHDESVKTQLILRCSFSAQLRLMDVAPKDLSQIASAMATIGQTEARNQLHHFISALWVKSVMKIFWSQMSGLSPLPSKKVLPVQNGVCVGCFREPTIHLEFTWFPVTGALLCLASTCLCGTGGTLCGGGAPVSFWSGRILPNKLLNPNRIRSIHLGYHWNIIGYYRCVVISYLSGIFANSCFFWADKFDLVNETQDILLLCMAFDKVPRSGNDPQMKQLFKRETRCLKNIIMWF